MRERKTGGGQTIAGYLFHFAVVQLFLASEWSLAAQSGEQSVPRCAYIDVSQSPVGPILEARLLAGQGATWVERNELERILREQKLQALFAPEAGAHRMSFGKLLNADVLVLLRAAEREKRKVLELIVCETQQGLRLSVQSIADDPRPDVATLEAIVRRAIDKHLEHPTEIWAVPSFVSNDLSPRYDHLQGAYARLIEQILLERKGTVVVELAEAQILAKEIALTLGDARLARRLPFYVLGEYRNEGDGDARRINISIKLERGEKVLATVRKTDLRPDQGPSVLRDTAMEFIKAHAGQNNATGNPAREAGQLAERAKEFFKLQSWDESLSLIEASLLIEPRQEEMRQHAVMTLGALTSRHWRQGFQTDVDSALRGLEYYRRGLDHLDALLELTDDLQKYRETGGASFLDRFRAASNGLQTNNRQAPQLRQTAVDIQEYQRQVMIRAVRREIQRGRGDGLGYLCWGLTGLREREQYAFILKMILELQHAPGLAQRTENYARHGFTIQILDAPEGRAFLDELSRQENAQVRAVAAKLKVDLAAYLTSKEKPPAKFTKPTTSQPDTLRLRPLELSAVTAQGTIEPVKYLYGCLPVGHGIDVLWNLNSIFVMKERGRLRRVWTTAEKNVRIQGVSFDGKYVWIPASRWKQLPILLVLDPMRESIVEFTRADGLPLVNPEEVSATEEQRMVSAAIGEGQTILAGSFGRTWIATAQLTADGKKSVRVFHEAREVAKGADKEAWQKTTILFRPTFCFTLTDKAGRKQVVIGRSCDHVDITYHPLIVDAQDLSVTAMEEQLWGQKHVHDLYVHDGSLYEATVMPPAYERLALTRISSPTLKREPLFDCPEGWIVFHNDVVHVVGVQWCTGTLASKRMDTAIAELPWRFMNHIGVSPKSESRPYASEEFIPGAILVSNHYGVLLTARSTKLGWRIFAAEPLPPENPTTEKQGPRIQVPLGPLPK